MKTWTPTKVGELYTIFEFELFGTGVDAGQTTFRLRHAYGELGAERTVALRLGRVRRPAGVPGTLGHVVS